MWKPPDGKKADTARPTFSNMYASLLGEESEDVSSDEEEEVDVSDIPLRAIATPPPKSRRPRRRSRRTASIQRPGRGSEGCEIGLSACETLVACETCWCASASAGSQFGICFVKTRQTQRYTVHRRSHTGTLTRTHTPITHRPLGLGLASHVTCHPRRRPNGVLLLE